MLGCEEWSEEVNVILEANSPRANGVEVSLIQCNAQARYGQAGGSPALGAGLPYGIK